MPAQLKPLLELAREQLGADVVLAFRWLDDSTARASVALPASIVEAADGGGAPLVLSLSRPAIEGAGGVLLETARVRDLVSSALRVALGAPARAAAVIAAAPGPRSAADGDADRGAGRSEGGLLAVWLGGASPRHRDGAPPDDEATAALAHRLAGCAPLLRAALGAVLSGALNAVVAGQLAVRLEAIMSAIPQAVIFVDDASESCAVNHAAGALLGLEQGAVTAGVMAERMAVLQRSLENEEEVRERTRALLQERGARVENWLWQVARPERRSLRVASEPVQGAGLSGRLWTIDDITREVDAERAARASESRFRTLSASSPVGIFQMDEAGRMTYANPRMQEIWQLPESEMLGRGWLARVHPDDLEEVLATRGAALEARREYELRYRLLMPDGTIRSAHGQAALLRNEAGEVVGGVGTVRDVTEQWAIERALARSEERLRLALEAAQMSAWDLDLRPAARPAASTGRPEMPSEPLALAFTGRPLRAYGSYAEFLLSVHQEDRARVDEAAARALAERRDFEDEFRVVDADGEIHWRYVKGRMMLSGDGLPERMVGVGIDSTVRKTLEEELIRRAYHDSLTGLPNRARFRERVEMAVKRAGTMGDGRPDGVQRGPTVLFIDLDGFKTVNDSLGHDAGDRLLVLVAERLLGATRGSDTTARLGGDEFAILLDRVGTHEDARIVAARVVDAIGAPFNLAGQEVRVGASVGIAIARDGDDASALMRNADMAMYRAKSSGKGRHAVYEPELHLAAQQRLELEAELPRAIERGEFVLVYQPIVELATGRVRGAEALVRWEHPERGPIQPLTFIPLAEATGDMVPLGRWVLAEACREAAGWGADAGWDGVAPTVSVNVSAKQLVDHRFVDDVAMVLRESGLPASSLVLEVTESALLADRGAVLERLLAIRALGVRLAIDDFGTGYSSLTYLHRFPFDVLKMDRTFTDGVTASGKQHALARAVVAIGDSLGLRTVAEGVETEAQRDALLALGCPLGQGYLYAKPLPAASFRRFVAEGGPAGEVR